MNWTTPADVRRQLERLWQRGDLLRAFVSDEPSSPLRLRLRSPTTREFSMHFAQVDEWVRLLHTLPGIRIVSRRAFSPVQGQAQLPTELWVDTAQAAIDALEEREAAKTFASMYGETQQALPEALRWLLAHPIGALQAQRVWQRALTVARWRRDHPDSAPVYLRQLDLPGIDTKFIEANTALLRELFELVCPTESVDLRESEFCSRYGFLREPPRVRFRLLDAEIHFADFPSCPDIELDAKSFAVLHLEVAYAFILENKTTYLSFPHVENAIAIFGAGYALRALEQALWLREIRVVYWGDIDTHGYVIPSQRASFCRTLNPC